ncbi:MAG: twin-arginine translocase TatA/TatE family subunit [Anaerolineae bacterium]|nr:twin-arginine translocase TatA/TatE family subunit [Anaerolineae bacterium]
MFGISPEWIIVLIIVILVFGIGKLPQAGKSLGEAIREFRRSNRDDENTAPNDSLLVSAEVGGVRSAEVGQSPSPLDPVVLPSTAAKIAPLTPRQILDQAATMAKEERLAFALNAILDTLDLTAYRLAKESGIDRATLNRWLKGETQPQQDKLEQVLDAMPGLNPHLRQGILALAGYITAEVRLDVPHPPQIYLSCHGPDLAAERDRLAGYLGHPMLAFNVEIGQATLPPVEVEASVRHSDYLVLVQGWRWVPARHIEHQAANEDREKVSGLYFQRKSELALQAEVEQFLVEVGQDKWQWFPDSDTLTLQVLQGLWQTLAREARAGRAISLPSLTGLFMLAQGLGGKEFSLSSLLQRLVVGHEQQANIQMSEPKQSTSQPQTWTKHHPEEPEMVMIPAGKFWMGSERLTLELAGVRWQDWMQRETPYHQCYLSAYAIGRYPVTNAEYARFIQDGGYRWREFWTEMGWAAAKNWTQPHLWNNVKWNQLDCPVVGVSWYEAAAYCRWLTKVTERSYRLPTEAEWEKAARGSSGNFWPWGDTWNPNCCNNAKTGLNRTTPVRHYSPNGESPYGVSDIVGNVWEWCATKFPFKPYPYDTDENEGTSVYLEGNAARVLRGGSWDDDVDFARCAFRNRYYPGYRDSYGFGFRVVVSPIL